MEGFVLEPSFSVAPSPANEKQRRLLTATMAASAVVEITSATERMVLWGVREDMSIQSWA